MISCLDNFCHIKASDNKNKKNIRKYEESGKKIKQM